MADTRSQRMGGVTEITLIADLDPGLVDVRETRTYATRLRILLRTLQALRQAGVDQAVDSSFVGPLERLQVLHFVRWSIIDNDQKLMLAVAFDGPWESYIRKIADGAGSFLDTIFCNCKGYEGHETDLGYQGFAEWVRERQVASEFFYAGEPGTSADDIRYLRKFEHAQRQMGPVEFADYAAKLRVLEPDEEAKANPPDPQRRKAATLRALRALHGLRELYPGEPAQPATGRRDHLFLLRMSKEILKGLDRTQLTPEEQRLHADALAWFESEEPAKTPDDERSQIEQPEIVQGNILAPYEHMTHGCLLLMRVAEPRAAKRFLKALDVTGALEPPDADGVRLNIGFTFAGLRTLGMPKDDLAKLPMEFQEGMEARASWLGDVGMNHPQNWRLPEANWPIPQADGAKRPRIRLSTVDFVIELQTQAPYAQDDHLWTKRHPLYAKVEEIASKKGVQLLAVEPLRRKAPQGKQGQYEHFGFRDGLSQPTVEAGPVERDRVAPGELLLGYTDDHGDRYDPPLGALENGTFLVIRKLRQHVDRFQNLLKDNEKLGLDLAAKMMGRDFEGRPTVDPERIDNDFDYDGDGDGAKCPFHSHIRRANPRNGPPLGKRARDTDIVPRIVRRGFSYGRRFEEPGAAPDEDRGLFFMGYNASIADQFEVIQRWISGANITGVLSAHNDPLMGLPEPGQSRTLRFLHQGKGVSVDMGKEPFVDLEWGVYLLVPSTTGVKEIASLPPPPAKPKPDPKLVKQGKKVIEQLQLLERVQGPDAAHLAWKKLLEDHSARETSMKVWAAIRKRGGVLRTPYGVLVGSGRLVMNLFRDHENFSVRGYGERMEQSLGALYLGMDPEGDGRYERESEFPNYWIYQQDDEDAFALALKTTNGVIAGLRRRPGETVIELRRFVFEIVAIMSQPWFGIPDGDFMQVGGTPGAKAHCPDDFGATARYIFSPNPTEFVKKEGRERGQLLLDKTREYVEKQIQGGSFPAGSLFDALYRKLSARGPVGPVEKDLIARVLVGSVHGFVGPTGGSSISVLHQWIRSEELWRLQQTLLELDRKDPNGAQADYDAIHAALWDPIVRAMQAQPFPYVLHRRPVRDSRIGRLKVKKGELVVLGLASATQDQPGDWEILLGGKRGEANAPVHACPGRKMAFGTILGIVSALLRAGNLRPVTSTVITLD